MKITAIETIIDLIPENSKLYFEFKFNQKNPLCLFIENEQEITNLCLDLDNPSLVLNNEPYTCIIFKGDLNIKNIYNLNLEKAIDLMVLGNLNAENIVVGGQEIFVTGEICIEDLFWGDQNLGILGTQSEIEAGIFVSTNDYKIEHVRQQINNDYPLIDGDDTFGEPNIDLISKLFVPEIISLNFDKSHYGWAKFLNRQKMIENLKVNLPVVNSGC